MSVIETPAPHEALLAFAQTVLGEAGGGLPPQWSADPVSGAMSIAIGAGGSENEALLIYVPTAYGNYDLAVKEQSTNFYLLRMDDDGTDAEVEILSPSPVSSASVF